MKGTWSLGGVSIVVEEDSLDYPTIMTGKQSAFDFDYTLLYHGGLSSMNRQLRAVIFSGFEGQFLPLVGSGYHTLISDQGTEGSFFITECKPERLSTVNYTTPVYRLALSLVKMSGE